MHAQGYAVLLSSNQKELQWANKLVLLENDKIASQLVSISMRRTVLTLIAHVRRAIEASHFSRTPFLVSNKLSKIPRSSTPSSFKAEESVRWFVETKLIESHDDVVLPTPLGKAVVQSGLSSDNRNQFLRGSSKFGPKPEADFEKFCQHLFTGPAPVTNSRRDTFSRFLVYPIGRNPVASADYPAPGCRSYPSTAPTIRSINAPPSVLIFVFARDSRAANPVSNEYSLHRLAIDIAWLDGFSASRAPQK